MVNRLFSFFPVKINNYLLSKKKINNYLDRFITKIQCPILKSNIVKRDNDYL